MAITGEIGNTSKHVSIPHQHADEAEPSLLLSIIVYASWAMLLLLGRCSQFMMLLMGKAENVPPNGYAPITSDFEDFYSRHAYGRVHDCWNRPIAGCAAKYIDVIERKSTMDVTKPTTETGRNLRVLNLGSYNYLGFGDQNSPTRESVLESVAKYSTATCSYRSDGGTTRIHQETEALMARVLKKEAAIIIGMGFGTNTTILNCLCPEGTLIISDSLNHNSIVNGSRSGGARIQVFQHNNTADLERVIRTAILKGQPDNRGPWQKIFIVVEGIYSMEGEYCNLPEIVTLKKKYGCYLFIDEAHSIGALGATGRGVCEQLGVDTADVDILMGTFTKSFGAVGGYIAADKYVVDYLRSTSLGSLYSSSISAPACQQIVSAWKIILGEDGTDLGQRKLTAIHENGDYLREKLRAAGFRVLGQPGSPVVPLLLYMPGNITLFSRMCLEAGIAVVVVGFPATPLLLGRVRFCVSAAHTKEELDFAIGRITKIGKALGFMWERPFSLLRFD